MDGRSLIQQTVDALARPELDIMVLGEKKLYDRLDEASSSWARITGSIFNEVALTTIASQQAYDLPPDFIRPHVKDGARRIVGRYVTSDDSTYWLEKTSYEKVFRKNATEAQDVPGSFAIIQKPAAAARVTGTATTAHTVTAGEVTLEDAAASFTDSVRVRDIVHNSARRTSGIVLAVTDDQHITCAMFPQGQGAWRQDDSYVIQPASRLQLVFDAPPANGDDVLTLPYVSLPRPVFSDYGWPGLSSDAARAITSEAAYLYQVRSTTMRTNPALHKMFLHELRQHKIDRAQGFLQGSNYLEES